MITTDYKENVRIKRSAFRILAPLTVQITDRNTIVAVARTATPVFAQLQAEYNEKIVAAEKCKELANEFQKEIVFPHLWGGWLRNKRKPRVRI